MKVGKLTKMQFETKLTITIYPVVEGLGFWVYGLEVLGLGGWVSVSFRGCKRVLPSGSVRFQPPF